MARLTRGKGNLRATVSGILANPAATSEMAKAIEAAMQPEVARVARVVRAATPVTDEPPRPKGGNPPPGSLRKAVDVYGTATKMKEGGYVGYVLMARADAATREPTKGDSRRSAARVAAHLLSEDRRLARAIARSLKKGKPLRFKSRKLDPKKGGRRYGPVPYGVFVDNESGFLTDTMTDEFPAIVEAIHAAIRAHAERLNQGTGTTPKGA